MNDETPAVLKFSFLRTPLPNEPNGTGDFYRRLGILMVAWGRLEGCFTYTLVNLMRLAGAENVSHKLPMRWDERSNIWMAAFRTIPALSQYEQEAQKLLDAIIDTAQDRNILAHGMWEEFRNDGELGINIQTIKHQKSTKNGMHFQRTRITESMLMTITSKINGHVHDLHPLSLFISNLEQPPENARII